MKKLSTFARIFLGVMVLLVAMPALSVWGKDPAPTATGQPKFKPMKLTYISHIGPDNDESIGDIAWQDEVTRLTGGAVTFERHWNSTFVPATEILTAVSTGMADLCYAASVYYPELLPLSGLQSVLYVVDKPDVMHKAMVELYNTSSALQEEYRKNNVIPVGEAGWAIGPVYLGAKAPKIQKMEDLKGRKIRSVGFTGRAVEMMGGTPVSTVGGEIYTAMDTGAVDGAVLALTHHDTLKIGELSDQIVDLGMGMYFFGWTVMNLDKWNSMSPELQDVFIEASKTGPKAMLASVLAGDIRRYKKFKDRGVDLFRLPQDEINRIRDALLPTYWERSVADVAKSNPAAADVFDRYLELVEKYKGMSTYKSPFE